MKRPGWDEFWFTIALVYSTRATCNRLLAATVLVDEKNRFISSGYNGSVSGMPHCDEVGHCMVDGHCIRTSHSEDNAVATTQDLEGATAYMIYSPCVRCTRLFISRGVKKLFYLKEFTNTTEKEKEFIEELVRAKGVVFKQVALDSRKLIADALRILESAGGVLYPPSC